MNDNNRYETDHPLHPDVTEQLRQAEDRFQKSFRASPTPQAIISRNGQRFYEANERFFTAFGYTREELRDVTLERLAVFADFATERKILEQIAAGTAFRKVSCQIETPDHHFRDAFLYAEPFSFAGAKACLLMIEDVTEQRQLESQLRQSQKMQVLGQLAAGVTHDFKNILTIIHGYTAVLLESGKLEEGVAKTFQKVNDAARRASRLTELLLAFSRQQRMGVRPFDLGAALRGFSEILTRCLTETISLEINYADGLPQIEGDPGQIEQVLMNLAVNARDAMPNGGKLSISTRSVILNEGNLANDADVKPGRYVCLSVSDSGCGMDAPTRERIFEPFFTTKAVGKGTGLGLATVNGIVKQHGGMIDVQSAPGAGTTFNVYFPTVKGAAVEEEPAMRMLTKPAIQRHKRILVVEDEAAVREVVCETLATTGYPVVPAADGLEALEIFSRASEPFDLLVTDMVMPNGISGVELANRLNRQQPALKVVYMSGYTPEWTGVNLELVQGVNFIPKPYDPIELLKTVADQLSAA
jgi:PAS domain S-box-containing protein